MAHRCSDNGALRNAISNRFSIPSDDSQLGKSIFRIEGFICTLFSNGTVQFQGKQNLQIQDYIIDAINKINSIN